LKEEAMKQKRSRYDPHAVPIPDDEMAIPLPERLVKSPAVRERFRRLGDGMMDFQSAWYGLAEQGVVPVITRNESDDGFNDADAAANYGWKRLRDTIVTPA